MNHWTFDKPTELRYHSGGDRRRSWVAGERIVCRYKGEAVGELHSKENDRWEFFPDVGWEGCETGWTNSGLADVYPKIEFEAPLGSCKMILASLEA